MVTIRKRVVRLRLKSQGEMKLKINSWWLDWQAGGSPSDWKAFLFAALSAALEEAIKVSRSGTVLSPQSAHARVKKLYTWQNVARRTEIVYDGIQKDEEIFLTGRIERSALSYIVPVLATYHQPTMMAMATKWSENVTLVAFICTVKKQGCPLCK